MLKSNLSPLGDMALKGVPVDCLFNLDFLFLPCPKASRIWWPYSVLTPVSALKEQFHVCIKISMIIFRHVSCTAWGFPGIFRNPSQSQTHQKKKKTSLIYSRGMYSIPQHQSTLVFTRIVFGAGPHADQKKKGEDAVPASSLFEEKKKKINRKSHARSPRASAEG